MTFEYLVIENVGNEHFDKIASKGGFATEGDAKAEGDQEAARIAVSAKRTLMVDVHEETVQTILPGSTENEPAAK